MIEIIGAGEDIITSMAWRFHQVKDWNLTFCFLPRTCHLTGRKIWLEYCYHGQYVAEEYQHSGQSVYDYARKPQCIDFYVDKTEHLIYLIKRA